ncbi:hypothetical protein N9X05_19445 [Paracoccaceae bacterium]|nr:hypothetical protein [Paracoccaceae bacterium]
MERITTLLITLFISLFSSPSWSDQSLKRYSDEVFKSKGSMSCKVKSNSITMLEDGIPKSYSSYTGRFKVGDLMTLTYGDIYYQDFEYLKSHGYGSVQYPDDQMVNIFFEILLTNEEQRSEGIDELFMLTSGKKIVTLRKEGFYISDHEFSISVFFGKDRINFMNHYQKISINRYYKNDWEVMVVKTAPYYRHIAENPLITQTYTLDCRHKVDKIDEIINFINMLH